jgi:hypothetical protein
MLDAVDVQDDLVLGLLGAGVVGPQDLDGLALGGLAVIHRDDAVVGLVRLSDALQSQCDGHVCLL